MPQRMKFVVTDSSIYNTTLEVIMKCSRFHIFWAACQNIAIPSTFHFTQNSRQQVGYWNFSNRALQSADGKAVRDKHGRSVTLPEREISLDKLVDGGWDYPDIGIQPEDFLLKKMEIENLQHCLSLLNVEEQDLIHALFFDELSEREYSEENGVAQKTINDRKHRILKKLKFFLRKS